MLQALEKLLITINRSSIVGKGEKRWSRSHSIGVDQALVDIVGEDPYAVPTAMFKNGKLLRALNGPAGGVVGRIEYQHPSPRGQGPQQFLQGQRPSAVLHFERDTVTWPFTTFGISTAFGHSGVTVTTRSPGATSSWLASISAELPEAVTAIRSVPTGH